MAPHTPVLHTNLLSPFHSSPPVGHGAQWQSHVIAHWERQFLANINRTLADQKGRDPIPGEQEPTLSSPAPVCLGMTGCCSCCFVAVIVIYLWMLGTRSSLYYECHLKREWCVTCGHCWSCPSNGYCVGLGCLFVQCLIHRIMNPPHSCSIPMEHCVKGPFHIPH